MSEKVKKILFHGCKILLVRSIIELLSKYQGERMSNTYLTYNIIFFREYSKTMNWFFFFFLLVEYLIINS